MIHSSRSHALRGNAYHWALCALTCPPPACHRQVHGAGSMPARVAMAGRLPCVRALQLLGEGGAGRRVPMNMDSSYILRRTTAMTDAERPADWACPGARHLSHSTKAICQVWARVPSQSVGTRRKQGSEKIKGPGRYIRPGPSSSVFAFSFDLSALSLEP